MFIDVLANDSDPNGDTLTVVEVSAPAHGTAVAAAAGTVEYTPEPDFHGTDRFTYVVGDGSGLTARAAVEVTLFGVGKVRAAALMKTFGAELVGNQRTLPRTKLLQQLKKHRGRAAFRGEEERRARLVAELQQARLTGVRFKVPAATMSAKLANLPEGVSVARGRIEVRFDGAENVLERLFALAQALGNDYVRFDEELVGR